MKLFPYWTCHLKINVCSVYSLQARWPNLGSQGVGLMFLFSQSFASISSSVSDSGLAYSKKLLHFCSFSCIKTSQLIILLYFMWYLSDKGFSVACCTSMSKWMTDARTELQGIPQLSFCIGKCYFLLSCASCCYAILLEIQIHASNP